MSKAYKDMTIAELETERDYWQARIDSAENWGAAVGVAAEFHDDCVRAIRRKKAEKAEEAR